MFSKVGAERRGTVSNVGRRNLRNLLRKVFWNKLRSTSSSDASSCGELNTLLARAAASTAATAAGLLASSAAASPYCAVPADTVTKAVGQPLDKP